MVADASTRKQLLGKVIKTEEKLRETWSLLMMEAINQSNNAKELASISLSIRKPSFINYCNKLSSISKKNNMLQVVATGAYYPPVATTRSIFCSKWRN